MLVLNNQKINNKYNTPSFKAAPNKIILNTVKNYADEIPAGMLKEDFLKAVKNGYENFQKMNRSVFSENIRPESREIVEKFMQIPGYDESLLPFFVHRKKGELEYLYALAKKYDISGEIRIPAFAYPYFAELTPERLKILEPIITSKNDMGLWNYGTSFILDLERFDEKQVEIMSKLVRCKVARDTVLHVPVNPYINWDKTVEKAELLNKIYGKKLREISFFSNSYGENYLYADIQLPHKKDKSDWQNFKRVYAKLDTDVNPIGKLSNIKNNKIDNQIDSLYNKILDKIYLFNKHDLAQTVENVMHKVPEADEEIVLNVMQRLTQFANYKCLPQLGEKLKENNIGKIYKSGEINPYFYYFSVNKNLFDLSDFPYSSIAYFVTKKDVQNPKLMKAFGEVIKSGVNIKFINLEGFSDGVNLFGDNAKLEKSTIKTLSKIKKILAKNPGLTLDEAMDKFFNSTIENEMKKIGAQVITIKLPAPPSVSTVLEQMNPYLPAKGIIKSTIESIARHYTCTQSGFDELCQKLASYYEANINVYSKQTIINELKLINKQINDFLKAHNLSEENLYILKPYTLYVRKSFDLITKMYADLFNINPQKIITMEDIASANSFPQNSVFVILDDIVGSGQSMMDACSYETAAGSLMKDKHILFAPLCASKNGAEYIRDGIIACGRKHSDRLICLDKNITDYKKTNNNFFEWFDVINDKHTGQCGEGGYGANAQCTVFPYMAPDNNSVLAGDLVKFFLPDTRCIKNKADNLNIIEEETYYYDVFGAEKDVLLTDAKQVFRIKEPFLDKIIEKLKKFLNNN